MAASASTSELPRSIRRIRASFSNSRCPSPADGLQPAESKKLASGRSRTAACSKRYEAGGAKKEGILNHRRTKADEPVTPKLPAVAPLPLTGLRVLDLTLARAGPTCVRHLADWGADVIRVEPPGSNEGFGGARDGFDFVNLHRNKRAIALDLKHPGGHAAFIKIVNTADVLVENMRPH